ncbi:RNA-splicing factor [Vermiconidia calcicola]|uniref:RNA-splicing factor n=1 Tax=Vermiconidia calcicola TaxID=1690605 RepID=A0ACC3N769_9PEZI|nr:RNA-splicing factor [Vermiconidia calcicola]
MADVAAPSFKKRTNKSSNIRKRPATPPPEHSASESDYTSDEGGTRVKRRKKDGVKVSSTVTKGASQDLSKSTKYSADRSTTLTANDDATKTSNWYVEAANAADAARASTKAANEAKERDNEGAYKGTASYGSYIQKNPNATMKAVGPVKAPTNVRMITVTDFAPDVCKDYKQTGFCGFGDSCKFLHAREDYKQGWQLDKEWEKAGKKDKKPGTTATNNEDDGLDEEEKLLESIPFACIICKEPYKQPVVVTKCGHYFCERCAMTRYMQEKKRACANCGKDTNGTFSVARKLDALLAKKRKRIEEKDAAEGIEVAENGEG